MPIAPRMESSVYLTPVAACEIWKTKLEISAVKSRTFPGNRVLGTLGMFGSLMLLLSFLLGPTGERSEIRLDGAFGLLYIGG